MARHKLRAFLVFMFIGFPALKAQASDLRTFLTVSAYGTGIGALAGVTALAFSEKPSENLNLVTRGASLGLYVGMGVGLYMISQPEVKVREVSNTDPQTIAWTLWVAPTPDGLGAGILATF